MKSVLACLVGYVTVAAVAVSMVKGVNGAKVEEMWAGQVLYDYAKSTNMMNRKDQLKGPYVSYFKVDPRCLGNTTLIFVSTGPIHNEIRKLLFANVPSFTKFDPHKTTGLPEVDFGADNIVGANTLPSSNFSTLVFKAAIRTIYKAMLDIPIDENDVKLFMTQVGLTVGCLSGKSMDQVYQIRLALHQKILKSPVAQKLQQAGAEALKKGLITAEYANTLVWNLQDGMTFAGMIGTNYLLQNSLLRIRSDPKLYVPMYMEDPWAFLIEQARVDPSVGSPTTLSLVGQRMPRFGIKFPKGCPMRNSIAASNLDPSVFGGPAASRVDSWLFNPKRANLGKMLTWNGELDDVIARTAIRGCLGYTLSLSVTRAIVSKLLPPVYSPPLDKFDRSMRNYFHRVNVTTQVQVLQELDDQMPSQVAKLQSMCAKAPSGLLKYFNAICHTDSFAMEICQSACGQY